MLPDMGGLFIGGSYLYANPLDGPCSVAYPEHIKGQPCVSQVPPNTNPDDTLPGFSLDTFYEAYLGYRDKSGTRRPAIRSSLRRGRGRRIRASNRKPFKAATWRSPA